MTNKVILTIGSTSDMGMSVNRFRYASIYNVLIGKCPENTPITDTCICGDGVSYPGSTCTAGTSTLANCTANNQDWCTCGQNVCSPGNDCTSGECSPKACTQGKNSEFCACGTSNELITS